MKQKYTYKIANIIAITLFLIMIIQDILFIVNLSKINSSPNMNSTQWIAVMIIIILIGFISLTISTISLFQESNGWDIGCVIINFVYLIFEEITFYFNIMQVREIYLIIFSLLIIVINVFYCIDIISNRQVQNKNFSHNKKAIQNIDSLDEKDIVDLLEEKISSEK